MQMDPCKANSTLILPPERDKSNVETAGEKIQRNGARRGDGGWGRLQKAFGIVT